MSDRQALIERQKKAGDQLVQMHRQFVELLPPSVPVERFERILRMALQNDELLLAEGKSLWNAALLAARDGLLPDGREGALVVYNTRVKREGKDVWIKRVQWMPMIFGIYKKALNSGVVAMMTARVVYDGDKYRYWLDEHGEHLLYEPGINQDRGAMRCVFAAARTKDGVLFVESMTADEIEKVRNSSRAKDSGPWRDWWEEMAKKTAVRRLSKRLPMAPDVQATIERDDELYDFKRPIGSQQQAAAIERHQEQAAPPDPDAEIVVDADDAQMPPDPDADPEGSPLQKAMKKLEDFTGDASGLFQLAQTEATALSADERKVFDAAIMKRLKA